MSLNKYFYSAKMMAWVEAIKSNCIHKNILIKKCGAFPQIHFER